MADNVTLGIDLSLNNRSVRDFAKSVGGALNQASDEWNDQVKDDFARSIVAGFQHATRSGQSGTAIRDFLKTNITDVYSKFNKELGKGNMESAARLDRMLDKRVRQYEREIKAQTDAWETMQERSARTWAQKADSFKDAVSGINQAMHMKDPSGYIGIGRQVGGRIQERGRARQEQADRLRKRGKPGDAAKADSMAKTGKLMAGIGASLATVAALAGAVLMLIKLFMDLNDRIVEMNKSILQTGTVSDMGIGGRALDAGHQFNTTLKTMRGEILSASSELMGFRVSADEMFAAVGALNEYGRGFEKVKEQIGRGAKHLKDYGDAAENVVAYSKLMGMSIGEMGTLQSRWANDFGQDLERVYEGLSAVRQEAVLSGFSMKRFVGTIMEATSGMGSYAVRVEEAAKTLKFLSNIMGETAGAELFKSLTNAFTEASTSDRLKTIFTTGQDEMQRIFADQALANAGGIAKDLKAAGYEGDLGENGEDLVKKLAGVSEEDRTKMLAKFKAAGYEQELIQRLDNLVETAKAGNGDLGAMVNAMSDMGPAGALAVQTQSQVFGGKQLHEFAAQGPAQRAAAEQITGKTGKAFEALVDASRGTSADMTALRMIQKEVKEDGRKLSNQEQLAMAELYGATVTASGDIVGATADLATGQVETGTKIEDEIGLMLAQNDRYKDAEEAAVSEDIKLARQIAQSTEKLSNVMEANMLKWLEKIYNSLYGFWMDFLRSNPFFTEDPGHQARIGAQNRMLIEGQDIQKYLDKNADMAEEIRGLMEKEEDPIIKAGYQAKLDAVAETDTTLRGMQEVNDIAKDTLANMDTEGMTQTEVLQKLQKTLGDQGYDLSVNTLDENAARNLNLEMKEQMDNFFPTLADNYEDAADAGAFGQTAHQVGFNAAQAAGVGGYQSLEIGKAAEAAAMSAKASGLNWEEAFPLIESAINREVSKLANESELETLIDNMHLDLKEITRNTMDTAKAGKKSAENMGNVAGALGGSEKAGDFLIRPGMKPILTDPNDTLMGFKPGGAFGMGGGGGGGGGGGPVNVNIYGGDLSKVYNEVMRVMKVLGHA